MYESKILCEISKGTFEIAQNISKPNPTKYAFTDFFIFMYDLRLSLNCDVRRLSETDLRTGMHLISGDS